MAATPFLHALALLVAALAPAPQEPEERPPVVVPELPPGRDVRSEMEELFARVERKLREIDVLLSDAAAGDVSLAEVEDSGLDDLLQSSREGSRQVLEGIDTILELARQQGASSSSSSGSQPEPPRQEGGSPLDRPGERPGEREATPETPGSQPEPQPQPSGEPHGDEETPAASEPENRPGDPPPAARGERSDTDPSAERWGDLPQRVREIFQSQGGGDLPPKYRDWIDAYYRRLNQPR